MALFRTQSLRDSNLQESIGSDIFAVKASNVGLSIHPDAPPIIENISVTIREGELIAIIGPSGSGKTTFLNMIAGLQRWTEGELVVRGAPPKAGRPDTAYALARDALLPWRDAVSNVELALQIRGVPKAERHERAMAALGKVGLSDAALSPRAHLSQGMRQRVALARTFVSDPNLLILDEPFAALDAQTRIIMQDLLLNLLMQFSGTMILVTHDLAEAITLADRILVFSRRPGRINAVHEVGLPRPRDAATLRGDPSFSELFDAIWHDLQLEPNA